METKSNLVDPLTDKAPAEYILEFSKSCPPWQQDVIRRLYTQLEFTEQDHLDALKMLKIEAGLSVDGDPLQSLPLELNHLSTKKADSPDVALHRLSDISNVNQLLENQTLRFTPRGMTVIFGENGSGKSGYCRILKQVCRIINDAKEEILGNVYEVQPGPSSAKVSFAIGTESKEINWSEGTLPVEELARISIFDSLAATFYTDRENKVEFVPFQLDIFERLSKVCNRLEEMLRSELAGCQKNINISLPEIPNGSQVKSALELSPSKAALTQLEALGKWTSADDEGMAQLSKKLDNDPVIRLAKLQQYKQVLTKLGSEVKNLWNCLNDSSINSFNNKKHAFKTAKEAANLAAKDFGEAEIHLQGTGGEAWRQLFLYAKKFSEVVYPGQQAPVLENNPRCVLCQQELDKQSKTRFTSFEKFIQSTAAQEARKKEDELFQTQQTFSQILPRPANEIPQLLTGFETENPSLILVLTNCFLAANKRVAEIKPQLNGEVIAIEKLSTLPNDPSDAILESIQELDIEITTIEKAIENCNIFDNLTAELNELKARKVLHTHLDDFLNCAQARILHQALESCIDNCKTTDISRKGGVARKLYISKEFETQLTTEIETLDLRHIPFKVAERNERGHHMLGVKLDAKKSHKPSKVLSQGEHRALALACFLTEVTTVPGHDGIIVDDPVSSLDHRRRRLVAKRLVEESKNRQVIIFTHDLVFLHELEHAATQEQVATVMHSIRKTNEGFGHVMEKTMPWAAMKLKDRFIHLNNAIASIRQIQDTDSNTYKDKVSQYYRDLRDTWERFVEEVLFHEVVQRFELGVQTMRLNAVEVTDDDYKTIYFNMSKASEFCHDEAVAIQRSFPKPQELETDLNILRQLATTIRSRHQDTRSKRKAITEAPPAADLV